MNSTNPENPAILFDTDMGNDVDDAMALVMVLKAVKEGKAELCGVLSSNSNHWAAPGIRSILDYYGYKEIPVGACCAKIGLEHGAFTECMARKQGLTGEETYPGALDVMRKCLEIAADGSVTVVATGFSTNLAAFLQTADGPELIKRKVSSLVMMAGHFTNEQHPEFNVAMNVPAFIQVINDWPTQIILSGFEIGEPILSRWEWIHTELSAENPVVQGYRNWFETNNLPAEQWDRPSWDQTAMWAAMFPDEHGFALSEPTVISVSPEGFIHHKPDEKSVSQRRFLRFTAKQGASELARLFEPYYWEPRR